MANGAPNRLAGFRPAVNPGAPLSPQAEDVAGWLEAKFRQGVDEAIQQAHQADIPVPVLGDDGNVAWLHPDGIVRPSRDTGQGGGQG